MDRIKRWIKRKLIKFLDIDNLAELLEKHIDKSNNSFRYTRRLISDLNNKTLKKVQQDISHFQQSVNTLHNTIENVVHIGTDVAYNCSSKSWAVICIEGKINVVKFIDLDRKYIIEILDFLKHFEAGRHCIDTPCKDFFYDGLFKF